MHHHAAIMVVCLATLLPTGASAVEFKHREPFVRADNCTCRFKGEDLPLGAQRCIFTPQGPRTSECVLEQNVTSWRPGQEPCPQAFLFNPRG